MATKKKAAPKAVAKKTTSNKITLATVSASIAAMVTNLQQSSELAHKAALQAFEYAEVHGDATACKRLYEALAKTGTIKGPRRQTAYLNWLKAFTPVRRNDKTGKFKLIPKLTAKKEPVKFYVPFDRDGAESVCFLDFVPDRKPSVFSQDKLHDAFTRLIEKKLTEAIENQLFKGEFDAAALQTHVNSVIASFTPPTPKTPAPIDAEGNITI